MMKVLDIYTKNDLDLITYNGVSITKMMDNFFRNFPLSYRQNYDRNMHNIEIHRVDEMCNTLDGAIYYPSSNVMLFKSYSSLPHEFMHVSSSDRITKKNAFSNAYEYSLYENGLIEGMTEFLSCMAKDGDPETYFFECFVVSMLSNVDGIFESFFQTSYDKLISLFPNKRDICSLMYGLDYYHEKIYDIDMNTSKDDISRIADSIRSVIDSLIDIELSFKVSIKDRKLYREKFMDLISDSDIDSIVGDICPNYIDYAYGEVNRRLLRRR